MRSKINFISSSFLRILFVLSVLVLALILFLSYKHNNTVSTYTNLIENTYEVNIQLENLIAAVKDGETNQRGYLITRDSSFLKTYLLTDDRAEVYIRNLQKLTIHNKEQQRNLQELIRLTKERYAYLKLSILYSNPETYNKDKLDRNLLFGAIEMEGLRAQVEKMKSIEKVILLSRQQVLDKKIATTPFFISAIALAYILIIILSYKQIISDTANLRLNNKKLLIASKLMYETEKIGSFVTWHWDVSSPQFNFSDNLYLLLGLKPYERNLLDTDVFLDFVHPDDKEVVANWMQRIVENKPTEPLIYYKVIRKDGALRYFQSRAKPLVTKTENLILGVTYDVTEEHNQNSILSDRNTQLQKSNQELTYFNRVASHDLQEPLRKIQTFISMVINSDDALSLRSREYLSKIEASAKRMRVLIEDLLLFTKSSSSEKEFVMTDLNTILDNCILELSQLIEENKAKITTVTLPIISVIPFQMQQVFLNLIMNAIKYRRLNVDPVIIINYKIISSAAFPDILDSSVKKYHKLTFTDNGIGFDPQFKKIIFVLFQRLHSNSEYPGTGIGLAICKKNIENHNGYIIADSQPNKGTVFTVFLPA